jgi:CRP-like cAMP-binding protein
MIFESLSLSDNFIFKSNFVTDQDCMLCFKKFNEQQFQIKAEEWEVMKEYFQLETLSKNEFFVSEGKVSRKLGFITEGIMRYCMFRDDGSEVTCFFMRENDFIGDPDSFFAQKSSDKNAQALTDCKLIIFTYENMHKLLQQLPRAKEINAFIDHYVAMKLLHQRTFLLNLDAGVRYKEFLREYPDVLQRIPLSYVANFLGIAQQSLSRLRKQMPSISRKED